MSSHHLQHHSCHHHHSPLGNVKHLQGTRPSTKNYRQLRMLRLIESLPQGSGHQLVTQCQVVSPENMSTSHMQVYVFTFLSYVCVRVCSQGYMCVQIQGHIVCVHVRVLGQLLVLHLRHRPPCF